MDPVPSDTPSPLEAIALRVVTLDVEDIPGLGGLLGDLDQFSDHLKKKDAPSRLSELSGALRQYAERLILGEAKEASPLEDGVGLLQEMERAWLQEVPWEGDTAALLAVLSGVEGPMPPVAEEGEEAAACQADFREFGEQDLQILGDFVVESMESLETIEVRLIDLEEDPGDTDTINAIFRPFHTIKGVSGFLDLYAINRLSHSTENLLDSARQKTIPITQELTDVVLESVDALRKLISCVEAGLGTGTVVMDCGVDVDGLIQRIDAANVAPDTGRLGEILVRKGIVSEAAVEAGLKRQEEEGARLGEILVVEEKVESREVISALREQKRGRQKGPAPLQVKVDTGKLDNLVDLSGELVIAQSMLRQNFDHPGTDTHGFQQNLGRVAQIVSGIQKIAMSMRMVPIGSTFQKMVRLVRDLSRSSGKIVALEMSGNDTEIDRNVVDTLYEPMVHMIRNSVDHGLEPPEDRTGAGKGEKGTIRLSAYHKGGNIIIEIADDGRGLDAARILEKGMERGLVTADSDLSDGEIFDLIFHPGFSTAQAVTDVSGRGVGMDVVKRVIETLRGRLDIRSSPGKGTTFIISLPLTMAIIEGMLVRVGEERYIIPTIAIVESFRPAKEDIYTVEAKGEMVLVRGELVALLRLGELCGVRADCNAPWEGLVVVVESKEDKRAILLDELLGKEEFVIKSLGESLKHIMGLAGGTILGDGRVGLILDIAGLFQLADGKGGLRAVPEAATLGA